MKNGGLLSAKGKFKKIDNRTIEVSDLQQEFQGATATLDFDNVETYEWPFVIKYFLTSEFLIYFNDRDHRINPWAGFSHLLFHEQSALHQKEISLDYRYPDDAAESRRAKLDLESIDGLLRCIIITVPEKNIETALDISSKTVMGILDAICLQKRIPIQLQRIEVLTSAGGMLRAFTTMPYMAVDLETCDIITINNIPRVFHPCLALYREAINTCNPYYRLLCLYRICERLEEIQGDNAKKLKGDTSFKRSSIDIPDNGLTRQFFPSFIGRSLKHFLREHVKDTYRNHIAHFTLRKGSVDANGNMLLPPADNKINSIVEATNTVLLDAVNMAIKEEIDIMKKYRLT